jgi:hypothetical protein
MPREPKPVTDPDRRRPLRLVAVYALLGAAWGCFARWAVPPIIASAYAGRSLPPLNRFFQTRAAPHPLEHYFNLWNWFASAVILAGCCHLGLVLWMGSRGDRRTNLALFLFAGAFLATTVLSGPRHDYRAFLEIWEQILRGGDPWWIHPVWGVALHAYGPLFNALTILAGINPLAPKLLFALVYLVFAIGILQRAGRTRIAWLLLVANPFPWVEIAYFGHFDVLVGIACVAAVDAKLRGRDGLAGAYLAVGVLLKFLPILLVPFFVFERRRFHPRALLSFAVTTSFGMALSWLIWGNSTFRPLTMLASGRVSDLLSVLRFLRGAYSPLRLFGDAPNLDPLASPLLLAALALIFVWSQIRRIDVSTSTVLAVLTTLMFYRVGFPQYWMVLLLLVSSWVLRHGEALAARPILKVALLAYLGWLGFFDLFYAAIGGIVWPGGRWTWVEDVVGLPTFLLGAFLLGSLFRNDRLE